MTILDLSRLLHLFEGNPDVIGADDARGPDMPGPLPITGVDEWAAALASHVDGRHGIGVYPYFQDGVRWGCIDFDVGDEASFEHATNVATVLQVISGIHGWLERSRSKGYHLWVFAPYWVSAQIMRRALLAACQIAEAPTDEINPKSEHLARNQIGNFVRLPYKGWLQHRHLERQVMVSEGNRPLSLPLFLEICEPDATDERLATLADVYMDPEPPIVTAFQAYRPTSEYLSPLVEKLLRWGPQAGRVGGRSGWLYAVAQAMGECGCTYEQIMAKLREADAAHGRKYADRKDAEARYHDLARKAVRRATP